MTFIQFLPDWAPNVHPMLVHFPIAIFFFAALMDLLSFVLPERWWGEKKTAITYLFGGIAVVIVFYTGKMAAGSLDIPKSLYPAIGAHSGWAHWTVWFFGIYAALRFILSFIERLHSTRYHTLMFVISLVGLVFLYETGEHGAKLVFGYGLGTGQLLQNQPAQTMQPQAPGFHQKSDGTISWLAGKDATHSLTDNVTFLQGDTASLNLSAKEGEGNSYALLIQSPHFFVVTDSSNYSNIQMEFTIKPGTYKGDIIIAHNVHDTRNYAYMALHPDGSAQLGRFVNGEDSIVKKGAFSWEGLQDIKLAVSGKHIHGYVNGEQILHGHSPQTGPGAAGLKLDGDGTLGLEKITISKISEEEHEAGEDSHEH